jgi:hypothetical protein
MPQNKVLQYLKNLFIKPKRDWSKSDREVLDNFAQLRKRQEDLQIQPLNQSTYNDRRFLNDQSPDFQGAMGLGGIGTNDRMPGSTPTLKINPEHRTKSMSRTKKKAPLI